MPSMSIINNTIVLFDDSFYSFNGIPRFIYQLIPLKELNREGGCFTETHN